MGRLKKSEEEKRLSGNPGKRELGTDPEIEAIIDTTPPSELSDKQIRYWNRYVPYMVKNRKLTNLNYSDLVRLCKFELALDSLLDFLADNITSLVQEKKNYHGEVIDLVESTYSKLSRNYAATIRTLKADLGIRTDKLKNNPGAPKPKSKFAGLINGKE